MRMMCKREYAFLITRGFKISEQTTLESFGDYCDVLTSQDYELIFISDRSLRSIGIRKRDDERNVFDLSLVRALILDESRLDKPISFETLEQFLIENIDEIGSLFDDNCYTTTKARLEKLALERAWKMFPGKSF